MKTILSKNAPQPVGPYSQAKETRDFVFLSGQIAINPKTSKLEGNNITEQTEQVVKNIEAVLKEAKLNLANVVSTTCFLKDINDYKKFNEVYAKHFGVSNPARATVEVSNLPLGALVEITVIAEK